MFKVVLFVLLFIAYGFAGTVFTKVYQPVVSNPIALQQFNDTPESFTGPASYNLLLGMYPYGWLVLSLLVVLAFWGDAKRAIKRAKGDAAAS